MAGLGYTLTINRAAAPGKVVDAIQRLEVDDSIDRASAFRIRLAIGSTTGGDWSLVGDKLFPPLTRVGVRVELGGGQSEHLITGYVTAATAMFDEDPGNAYLEVAGVDATAKMNLQEKVRPWPNLADSKIAEQIFGDYKLKLRVTATSPARQENEVITTQRTTDIRFLRYLAFRNGFTCYVTTNPTTGAEEGVFGPLDLDTPAQGVLSVRFGEATSVDRFTVHHQMLRPTTAEAMGVDAAKKSTEKASSTSQSETVLGRDSALDLVKPAPVVLPFGTGVDLAGELSDWCRSVVDRSAWAVRADGAVKVERYGKALRAGRPVAVRGAGSLYNGTYLVRRVLHGFAGEEYTQEFELARNGLGQTSQDQLVDVAGLAAVG
jgi:phage protein D